MDFSYFLHTLQEVHFNEPTMGVIIAAALAAILLIFSGFASGSEIYNIYDYARERNHVNMRKLLRYASRRNRKEKVEHIIYTIDHDQSQE